jgi:hypothetical protein
MNDEGCFNECLIEYLCQREQEKWVENRKKAKEERDFYEFSRRCLYRKQGEERSEQTKLKGGLT